MINSFKCNFFITVLKGRILLNKKERERGLEKRHDALFSKTDSCVQYPQNKYL